MTKVVSFINDPHIKDKQEIELLVTRFFTALSNMDKAMSDPAHFAELFVPTAVIIRNSGTFPEVFTVGQFPGSQTKVLAGETSPGFLVEELAGTTGVYGNIAHRYSAYRRTGVFRGKTQTSIGMKSMQFLRVSGYWKISAVIWDNDKE